jgi:hypothetical protein
MQSTSRALLCLIALTISGQALFAGPNNETPLSRAGTSSVVLSGNASAFNPSTLGKATTKPTLNEYLRDGLKPKPVEIKHDNNIAGYWSCFAACMILTDGWILQCKEWCGGGTNLL